MAKLSMLVTAMEEVVVDYCGPGTRSVIRLQGESFTPKQQKPKAAKKSSSPKGEKPKPQKQRAAPAPPGAGPEDGLIGMDEVRTRMVSLVQSGNEGRDGDSFGGIDMARIAPLWTKAYGSKLVPTQYGYAKLGPMIAAMSDILVVDHIHKTKKVVRLAGAPGVNGPPTPSETTVKQAKRGAQSSAASAVAEPPPQQDDGWGQPAALGGWDDPASAAGTGDWGSSEAEPSIGWDDPPAQAPVPFGIGLPGHAPGAGTSPSKKVFSVSPRFDSMQQAALGAPLQAGIGVGTTAQLFGLPQPDTMNASVQTFFGQAAAGFGTQGTQQHDPRGHVAPSHSTAALAPPAPVQPASPPADQLLFGAPLPDEGWAGSEAADSAVVTAAEVRRNVPMVDTAVAAERAAAKKAKEERKREAQKAKRDEAKLKKRAAAEAKKAAEAEARKQKKELDQAGKRGKALCGKLRSSLAGRDPRLMWTALADADRFQAQFDGVDLPAVAQEVEAIAKLHVDVKAAYTAQALEAIEAMTNLLDSDDLGAVSSAVNLYDAFSEDSTVEAIRGVLLNKVDAAKTELREAAAAADRRPVAFANLNATIEKYASHSRVLFAEIRDAKTTRSTLLSQCAKELGGLVHKSAKKGSTVTAAQIEKKLAQYEGFPEEGSIGESMSTLRPLLAKIRKEEDAKAKVIAAQKAKEDALRAKKQRAEQQAKEDAEFWAAHEQATLAEQMRQDQLMAEAAARAEAMAAAREAEKLEAEKAAAARQAEEAAANKAKELTAEEKAARKAAKKARQAEEKAEAAEENKRQQAEEAAAKFAAESAIKMPSVLKTSPHFSPLREGDNPSGSKTAKKVAWLDLDEAAAQERELRKAEKKREANRKKKAKKKAKAATAAAGSSAEPVVADSGDITAEQVDQGGDDDDDNQENCDDIVDFATDSYKEHYDAMEELD